VSAAATPILKPETAQLRSLELGSALGILSRRTGSVTLVCGAPGMGKSSLLRRIAAQAIARGWRVAADFDGSLPAVDPVTSARAFRDRALAAVAEAGEDGARPPRADQDSFAEELTRWAPVLLLIDDYRPGAALAHWFAEVFLPQIRRCDEPVVVVIAHRPGGGELKPLATDTIDLEDLDPQEVRDTLAGALADLDPPLEQAELDVYAEKARNPLLLTSLIRALRFSQAETELEP
jgi:hypothetical protein